MKRRSLLGTALALVAFRWTTAKGAATPDSQPKRFFVLFHSPGPHWDQSKGFQDQAGIGEHVAYMKGFLDRGMLVMGGPFLDNSGGMMVFDLPTIEAARATAERDPAVENGLLTVAVKPWLVALSRN